MIGTKALLLLGVLCCSAAVGAAEIVGVGVVSSEGAAKGLTRLSVPSSGYAKIAWSR